MSTRGNQNKCIQMNFCYFRNNFGNCICSVRLAFTYVTDDNLNSLLFTLKQYKYLRSISFKGPAKGYHHSVCRQCCDTPNCVKDPDWWYPQTRAEWAYTGEETPAYPADPYPAAGGY